jgi:cyclophilin family peptidyl-prolyl cis-trans isomerase
MAAIMPLITKPNRTLGDFTMIHAILNVFRTRAHIVALTLAAVSLGALSATTPGAVASGVDDTSPVYVRMTTSLGDIYLELDRSRAPITVANFVRYVEDEFYDGTIFHRVIPNFMIQGGGFTKDFQQKPTRDPIRNEWRNGLINERGTIAMARTGDPDSATAQFFINVANNTRLSQASPQTGNAGYAVFGHVVHGMEVVDTIRHVPTGAHGVHQNVPIEPVLIERVRIVPQELVQRVLRGEPVDEKPEPKPEPRPEPRPEPQPQPEPDRDPGAQPDRDSPNPAAPNFNHAGSDARAVELADAVMDALGGRRAWDRTRHIRWSFFNQRRHIWDRQTNRLRLEYADRERQEHVVVLLNLNTMRGEVFRNTEPVTDAEERAQTLEHARDAWINDSYWLLMPFKMKDDGVTLRYLGTRSTTEGKPAEVVEMTFEGVGNTPENKYHVYIDPDSHFVVQWDFFRQADQDQPDMSTPWRNWKRYGGILLSDDRGEGRVLQHLGVAERLAREVYTSPEPLDHKQFTVADRE